jgi:hypothetical protein
MALFSRCGICSQELPINWSNRQGQVCRDCETRAVDSTHLPIVITHGFSKEATGLYFKGPTAFHSNAENEECDEVNQTNICWVDGIRCRVWEGRFGNIGLVVADVFQERLGSGL